MKARLGRADKASVFLATAVLSVIIELHKGINVLLLDTSGCKQLQQSNPEYKQPRVTDGHFCDM